MNIVNEYEKQVQPNRQFRNSKLQWVETRADKEIRYDHFYKLKSDINTKERWSIDLIKMAIKRGKKPVVSSSFGIDSTVIIYLTKKALEEMGQKISDVDIVWNDTKNEFKDVRVFSKWLEKEWDLNLIVTAPKKVLKKVIEDHGGIDSSYFTARKGKRSEGQPLAEKCCNTLKHEPMNRATKENQWDLIINGLRADESMQRKLAGLRDGEFFYSSRMWKAYVLRPILWWTEDDLWEYIEKEDIPYNDLYNKNMIQSFPKDKEKFVADHKDWMTNNQISKSDVIEEQLHTVTRPQALYLQRNGFKVFAPRTGCQMCPIPIKYGYMGWLRKYYPKVYNAMVYKLGYGPALLDMVDEKTRLEIEMLTGVDITAENAHEHLVEVLEGRPCIFDEFN